MANQPLKNNWSVRGRLLVSTAPGLTDVIADTRISIPENEPDIDMRPAPVAGRPSIGTPAPNTDSYGTPIDANLAVHLIRNNKANKTSTTFKQISSNILLEFANTKIDLPLAHTASESDKAGAAKTAETTELTSLTVTFDKSIILKILSQPKCEGIRCYLCSNGQDPNKHYSILLIGVDAGGYDLNYKEYINTDNKGALADNVKIGSIDTNSLMADFGYPPDTGSDTSSLTEVEIPEQYVLRKLADMQ